MSATSAISVTCRFLTLDNVFGIYISVDIIILTATFTEDSVMSFGCPLQEILSVNMYIDPHVLYYRYSSLYIKVFWNVHKECILLHMQRFVIYAVADV